MNRNKNEEWDKLDEFLSKKVMEFKVEKLTSEEINVIISKAKAQKRREKYLIAASITVMILLALSTFYIYKSRLNKDNTGSPTLVAEEESNFDIIIEEDYENYTATSQVLSSALEQNVEVLSDITDIEVLKNNVQQMIIARVNEIEKCTNYDEKSEIYTRINTLGNLEVLQVIKGDLEVNSIIPFIRAGGTISYDEYQKGVIYGNRSQIQGTYDYVTERKKGDIDIEEGKTYLMVAYYNQYSERYEIIINQYGLREYNQENNTILNNETGEWEDLNSILN